MFLSLVLCVMLCSYFRSGTQNKTSFLLCFARLLVTLALPKLLSLGNTK